MVPAQAEQYTPFHGFFFQPAATFSELLEWNLWDRDRGGQELSEVKDRFVPRSHAQIQRQQVRQDHLSESETSVGRRGSTYR